MWFLLACTSPTPVPPTSEVPATEVVEPTGDTGTVDTDTEDTDVVPLYRPEQLVCTELPPLPTEFVRLPGFGPHEDFGFDATGMLIGVDGGGNLIGRDRQGATTLISPNVGEAKGTRYLPDGSIAIALSAEGALGKVLPDGQKTVVASIANPNGIAVDIHGHAWVATGAGTVVRVDTDGTQLTFGPFSGGIGSLDGIALSPDFRRIYFNSEFGAIRTIELDDAGDPVGDATLFATLPLGLGIAILDGMTTDMCGNVYVVRMDGRVYRILPDGTIDGFINFGAGAGFLVMPAANFGSGVGGFERDRLYAMNFLGGVFEAEIGIEGHWEPHYPVPQ